MLKVIAPLAALLLGGIQVQAQAQAQAQGQAQAQARPQAPPADTIATAPRISAADAKKAVDAGKAVLVDVRSAQSYQQEHAKGALSVPTHEIAKRMSELPKDKQIITYCT